MGLGCQCRFIASVGYTGIEVAPFTLARRIGEVGKERRQLLRRQAEENGLAIIGLHWLLAKTEGLHLTSADPAVRRATADYLDRVGTGLCRSGGRSDGLRLPAAAELAPGVTREEGFANAAEVFRAALPAIADAGVRICLEPLTPQETNFLNTCAEAMELIERIDQPNLCLHQDVKAMLGGESTRFRS